MEPPLRNAVTTVMHDVAALLPIGLEVVEEPSHSGPSEDGFWLVGHRGDRAKIWVSPDVGPGPLLALVADRVQDFVLEDLPALDLPALWPECPLHPNSHPLSPSATSDVEAVWLCPRNAEVVGPIGTL